MRHMNEWINLLLSAIDTYMNPSRSVDPFGESRQTWRDEFVNLTRSAMAKKLSNG